MAILSRNINFTGRKKIDRSHVKIELIEKPDKLPEFNAMIDLSGLELPDDAKVYIEAYHKTSRQRFDCGTVKDFKLPEVRTLNDVDMHGPTLFHVKVVDESVKAGKLLALAERIRPLGESDGEDHDWLVKLSRKDIGDIPWRLSLQKDDKPELIVNSKIPGVMEGIKHDPLVQGWIFPAIIREVFVYIYSNSDGGYDESSWQDKWLVFGEKITGEIKPPFEDFVYEQACEWVEDIVDKFCRFHDLCSRMTQKITEG